jgi:hypothetical protein
MKALNAKTDKYGIGKATVVFYGLTADKELLDGLRKRLKRGCRLLYYYNGIFPEIMPEKTNFPFYLSTAPFKKTVSEKKWLRTIIPKRKSSIKAGTPSVGELWSELRHDLDVYGHRSVAIEYQKWMGRYLKRKRK